MNFNNFTFNSFRTATYQVGNSVYDATVGVGNSLINMATNSDSSHEQSTESQSIESKKPTESVNTFDFPSDFSDASIEEYSEIKPVPFSEEKSLMAKPEFSSALLKVMQHLEFTNILNLSQLPKVFIVDEDIENPLSSYIISILTDKKTGEKTIDTFKITQFFLLSDACIEQKNHHYIYLFRPTFKNVQNLTKIFTEAKTGKTTESLQRKSDGNIHTIYFVPNHDSLMKQTIRNSSYYYTRINYIGKCNLNIFPVSNKLLTMENPKILKMLVDNDQDLSPLQGIVRAISYLEKIYGKIPNIQDFGRNAEKLYRMIIKRDEAKKFNNKNKIERDEAEKLKHKTKIEQEKSEKEKNVEKIKKHVTFARMILIDREMDLITPCLTPSSFEGLIDDIIGISGNIINIEKKYISKEIYQYLRISGETPESTKIRFSLDNNKKIFSFLKDQHVSIDAENEFSDLDIKFNSIREMHKRTAAKIIELSEDKSAGLLKKAIKLVGANNKSKNATLAYSNVKSCLIKKYDSEFFDHETNILLKKDREKTLKYIETLIQEKKPITKVLRLLSLYFQVYRTIKPNFLETISKSMSEAYGDSSRLALKRLAKLGMLSSADFVEKCSKYHLIEGKKEVNPGIFYPYKGYVPLSCRYIEQILKLEMLEPCEGLDLVVFIGGVTRAEVAALKNLSKKIVVLTTSLINGNSFMENLLEK